jgi:hypothetical protein
VAIAGSTMTAIGTGVLQQQHRSRRLSPESLPLSSHSPSPAIEIHWFLLWAATSPPPTGPLAETLYTATFADLPFRHRYTFATATFAVAAAATATKIQYQSEPLLPSSIRHHTTRVSSCMLVFTTI